MWLWGDHLSAGNLFQGFDGNDEFALYIGTDIGSSSLFPVASLQIEGNSLGGDSENRDRLSVYDQSGAARSLTYDYLDSLAGDVDILGFPVNGPAAIQQFEDDGAIPLANPTGISGTGFRTSAIVPYAAGATIGDGPYGATSGDYDWYSLSALAGQPVRPYVKYAHEAVLDVAEIGGRSTSVTVVGNANRLRTFKPSFSAK